MQLQIYLMTFTIQYCVGISGCRSCRNKLGDYQYVLVFCKSATLAKEENNGFVFTPGRYVSIEEVEDDGISFEDKVSVIAENLSSQFAKSIELQERIITI